jgi:predicted RNA-binding Zn ribbon-like protein
MPMQAGEIGRERNGKALKVADLTDLEPLNQLLERDELFGQLVAHKRGKTTTLELRRVRRWRSPESLLLPLAEALAKFLAEENFSDVKACEGPTCTLLFADHTRGRSRRWCSMGICGNRAKQTAHRHRLKKQALTHADPKRISVK